MNKTFSNGPALHRLIEDAPIDLLTKFLPSHAKTGLGDLGLDLAETPCRKHFTQALSDIDDKLARRLEATRVLVLSEDGACDSRRSWRRVSAPGGMSTPRSSTRSAEAFSRCTRFCPPGG